MIDTSNLVPAGTQDQPVWVSGGSYVVGQQVVSPARYNIYVRKTIGGGVTDPSADGTNWMPIGNNATTSLYNACSTAGYTPITSLSVNSSASNSTSGALTANTLVDLINESGSAGYLSQLSIYCTDATSRTLRIVVTVDGTDIYDFTSAAISAANSGAVLAGNHSSGNNSALPPIYYTNSIRVQYASSVTETGKFTISLARNQVT